MPIGDVIDSLIALRQILDEGGSNLGSLVPGLTVEKVQVTVRQISQESPLREIFLVTLYMAFQKDLEVEVPAAFESLTGIEVSDKYNSLLILSSLVVIYYGIGYAKDVISKLTTEHVLKTETDEIMKGLAATIGVPESVIRSALKAKYRSKKRLKSIALAAIKFFRPSRAQANVGIEFGDRKIEPRLIAETPQEYELEGALKRERATFHGDVPL